MNGSYLKLKFCLVVYGEYANDKTQLNWNEMPVLSRCIDYTKRTKVS